MITDMTDILYDDVTKDDLVQDGDDVLGDATKQNQEVLIYSAKNELKQYPTSCVGAIAFIEDEEPTDFIREIKKELVADGQTVNSITVGGGKIIIDANYGNK